ncbi:MAG: TAXI family TRAP transporter solute-binding subunit [Pseudomonadota bacterium]
MDDVEGNSLRVLPIIGRGGGQNFIDTLFLEGIDMAIVEQDVMVNFNKKDPGFFNNLTKQMRYIVKLSNSEMHLFVSHDIKKLSDLNGKKVSFYKPHSSSAQATENILNICNIEVQRVYADNEKSAHMFRSGEVSAIGRLSGAPYAALEEFKAEDGHFLPLNTETLSSECYERLSEIYLPAYLKHEYYPHLIKPKNKVQTFANATLLVTYNFPQKSERYKRIANFVDRFFNNIGKFKGEVRHPKWKEINIPAKVQGWTRFQAAQGWIDANRDVKFQKQASRILIDRKQNMRKEFEHMINTKTQITGVKISDAEKKNLFQQFLKYWHENSKYKTVSQ